MNRLRNYVNRAAKGIFDRRKVVGGIKYFCVGRNKGGTTSVKRAFEGLPYPVGNQRRVEILTGKHSFEGNFRAIIDYCKTAQVLHDVPLSYPETYKRLDKACSASKRILTVIGHAERWYRSVTAFHANMFGKNARIPTVEHLTSENCFWTGLMHSVVRVHGAPDSNPYKKDVMVAHYERHHREVIEYFKDRPDDLLAINVLEMGGYQKFVDFLSIDSRVEGFAWGNRTRRLV